jgi:methionine--tRNA ligase beta chain
MNVGDRVEFEVPERILPNGIDDGKSYGAWRMSPTQRGKVVSIGECWYPNRTNRIETVLKVQLADGTETEVLGFRARQIGVGEDMGNTTNVTKEDLKTETPAPNATVTASADVTAAATVVTPPAPVVPSTAQITFEQFKAVDMRVGLVKSVEAVPKSDKLLMLTVDFGELGSRLVLAGIAKTYPTPLDGNTLVGRSYAFVVNLEPRKMFEVVSQAMLLAVPSASDPAKVVLVDFTGAAPGSRLA